MVNKANFENKIFTEAKYVAFLWHNYFQAFAKPIQLNFFRNSILAFGESRWKATNVAFQAGIPTKPLPTIEILQEMHFAVVANIYMGKTEHNTFECGHMYM